MVQDRQGPGFLPAACLLRQPQGPSTPSAAPLFPFRGTVRQGQGLVRGFAFFCSIVLSSPRHWLPVRAGLMWRDRAVITVNLATGG